jgi:DNA-binding HxlR family transcriptional regulator
MPRPTYAELGDACATAHAMELIGARWTYPILRELMLGPKRFAGLLTSVRGITPAVLSARLDKMAIAGLVEPGMLPAPANAAVYDLTPWARELAPILRELGRWAHASPVYVGQGGLTPDATVQAMLTFAEHARPARPLQLQLHLFDARVDAGLDYAYRVVWTSAAFSAQRGDFTDPPCTLRCDSTAWGRVLFSDHSLGDSGAQVTGDPVMVESFIESFRDQVMAEDD